MRRDPVIGRWVIVAPERSARPVEFTLKQSLYSNDKPEKCPFCEGKESMTPPEIMAFRNGGGANCPGWETRVVPNKFPALRIEGSLERVGQGIYDIMTGIGAHEVIIESPQHLYSTSQLSVESVRKTIIAYKHRILDLRNDKRIAFCLVFKNVGEAAGASLSHTHSQLIATPIVPLRVLSEINYCKNHFDFRGRCVMCDVIKQEITEGTRVVIDSDKFIVIEPFAPRFAFETWILPKSHQSHFEYIDDAHIAELAGVLKSTIAKLEAVTGGCHYNYLIHSTPINWQPVEHYHWHIEILPRITRVAGFEWGSGFYINPVTPEDATKFLKSA